MIKVVKENVKRCLDWFLSRTILNLKLAYHLCSTLFFMGSSIGNPTKAKKKKKININIEICGWGQTSSLSS